METKDQHIDQPLASPQEREGLTALKEMRKLHMALNVCFRQHGAEYLPACDGPDCKICESLAAIAKAESAAAPAFKCKARRTADPPEDCDWPTCGCDPYADKVIAALEEGGLQVTHDAAWRLAYEIVRTLKEKRPHGEELADVGNVHQILRREAPCLCRWDLPHPFNPNCPVHGPKDTE